VRAHEGARRVFHGVEVRHVGDEGLGGSGKRGSDLLQRFAAPREQADDRPARGIEAGQRLADAARGAGDEDAF
jgi:hypothetical protein